MTGPRPLVRAAVGFGVAGVVVLACVAVLGPSAASPELDGAGPARSLAVAPAAWVVTVGMWAGLLCAGASVLCAWLALQRGWQPPVRRAVAVGFVGAALLAAVPPLGSTDVMSYAGYGRMVVVGLNPYTTTINDLVASGDPVGVDYDGAWPDVSSVYGPVALGVQGAASWLSGASMRWFVMVMQLVALAAFAATTALLLRTADGADGRRRAAVLWAANPLLMYLVVNSAHLDGVAVALGVAALASVRRSPALAGLLSALAVCTKISFVLYAVALTWALRRGGRQLLALVAAGTVTGLVLLGPFVPEIVAPLQQASRYVARVSVWHFVDAPLHTLLPEAAAATLLAALAWLLTAAVVWRLSPVLPRRPAPGGGRTVRDDAIWTAALVSTAWLLCTPYALPWYDVIAWAPLLLVPASGVDLLLLARTATVSVAYVPGVVAHPPGAIGAVISKVGGVLAPLVSWALVLLALLLPDRLRPRPPTADRLPASSR